MVSISSFMGNTRRSGSSPCKSLCSLSHSSEMIGTLYLIPVYPELVALIGASVPDYRGIFLRGHGSQVSTHYGSVTHSSAGLGQLQGDAIRQISGEVEVGRKEGKWPTATGLFSSRKADHSTSSGSDYSSGIITFDSSKVTPTAQEIRPVNRSVRYLIRAR